MGLADANGIVIFVCGSQPSDVEPVRASQRRDEVCACAALVQTDSQVVKETQHQVGMAVQDLPRELGSCDRIIWSASDHSLVVLHAASELMRKVDEDSMLAGVFVDSLVMFRDHL